MAILRAKIQAPAVPGHVIQRPRLLNRIAAGNERLVVLEAPGGYGKSVLAAQLRAAAPRATAWLHLDPEDGEPRRLAQYISAALAEVLPSIDKTELHSAHERADFDLLHWADSSAPMR